MKELGEALKVIFQKVGDFFDIFDLSFLLSGAVMLGAVLYTLDRGGVGLPAAATGAAAPVLAVVVAYVLGLMSFAFFRMVRSRLPWLRGPARDRFGRVLDTHLEGHDLRAAPLLRRYESSDSNAFLYTRLWVELRQRTELLESFSLCKRYWVMAATYDGLASASLVWSGVLWARVAGFGKEVTTMGWETAVVAAVLLVLTYVCSREAGRCELYQVAEVVATMAHVRDAEERREEERRRKEERDQEQGRKQGPEQGPQAGGAPPPDARGP